MIRQGKPEQDQESTKKGGTKRPGTREPVSFEEALARLERLVGELEEGELPLDEAIARFEEGLRLVKACRARLEAAELKVKHLMEEEADATGDEDKPAPR